MCEAGWVYVPDPMTTMTMTTTCFGCHKPIDPAFDSIVKDEHGREWHTPCRIAKVGAGDKGDDVDVLAASPLVWLGVKAFRRLRGTR